MARSNPIGKIKDTALGTIKGSVATTQDVVGQAVDKARDTVETVTAMVPGRKSAPKKSGASAKSRALRDAPAVEAEASRKVQGDPLAPAATKATKKTAGKKASAKKAPAKKAAAKKAPATKAPATKAPAKKAPAKKTAATKTAAKKAPAKKAAAKKAVSRIAAASDVPVSTTADELAKQAPAKKTAKKTAAKKSPAKKAAKKTSAAVEAPAAETVYSTSSEDGARSPGPSAETPALDRGTAKAVLSDAETLSKAADPHKG